MLGKHTRTSDSQVDAAMELEELPDAIIGNVLDLRQGVFDAAFAQAFCQPDHSVVLSFAACVHQLLHLVPQCRILLRKLRSVCNTQAKKQAKIGR